MRATIGRLASDCICANGRDLKASASSWPAEEFAFTIHRRPYCGGSTKPAPVTLTAQPESRKVLIMSSANVLASSSPCWNTSTTAPAWVLSCATKASCSLPSIRRHAIRDSSLTRANLSDSAIRFASAALSLAFATSDEISPDSFFRRSISPCCERLSALWRACNLRLFHQWRMPKYDSPATPTTTRNPNINSQISILASNASSPVLSIEDLAIAALWVAIVGLLSLIVPVLALMRIVEHRRARRL